ncbi:MAG: hypothetical protein ACUVRL_00825 [Candidatus Saccharicenans sp.]|uniref:hypothetical protein n=1 Tax=Candidatus Saccharicenans sp. TaxID=2819258 RepID=UPI00404A62A5
MASITIKKLLRLLIFTICAGYLLLTAWQSLQAQNKDEEKISLNFSGFIKTDVLYDTRQTVSIREGHFLLYPKDQLLDPDGRDLNAKDTFHILSIQTRLALKITGPKVLNARPTGYIEGEFFGHSDPDINGFRLRHAYLKLNWEKTELLIGQFWHPMFITESFPEVVSFNTGAPFEPFSRAPQLRFTWTEKKLSLSVTALAQRDFASTGPDGVSTVYFRNAAFPELDFKAAWTGKDFMLGGGVNFLKLVPRLATSTGYQANESITSGAGYFFGKLKTRPLTVKAQVVYGGNLHHLTMLGGYGVTEIGEVSELRQQYAPVNTGSAWIELQTNGNRWQAGLFGGYSKNYGARKEIIGPIYSRGDSLDHLFRISPRVIFNAGKVRLAQEIELTSAAYGTRDLRGRVSPERTVTNLRLLFAAYYFF